MILIVRPPAEGERTPTIRTARSILRRITSASYTVADSAGHPHGFTIGSIAMTVSPSFLVRGAGAAAVAAGAIFVGVNINHPHLDIDSIATTELAIRNTLKVLMCALAVIGITGMYLGQVRRNGVLGLVGYLVLSAGYLLIMCTTFAAAYVLPSLTETDPSYVQDAFSTGPVVTR